MSELKRPAPKPQCGRCFGPVKEAYSEPITGGFRLTYNCHGESISFEVTAAWMEEFGSKTPFFPDENEKSVFKPEELKPASASDVFEAEFVAKQRKRRLAVNEFVLDKIRTIAESQLSYGGDLAVWCGDHKVQVVSVLPSLLDQSVDLRSLVIDGITVGQFELPFWPDKDEMKWVSTSAKASRDTKIRK